MNYKAFIVFLIIWIAENLSVPFWMVGHVHITLNMYEDIHEIIASMGMNIIVGIGFWLSWRKHRQEINNK
jgi:ABC-type nickel/cobalt efflux system permease component RcnA